MTSRPRAEVSATLALDGFVALDAVVTRDELEGLRQAFDRAVAGGTSSDYGSIALDAWRAEPDLAEAIARLGELVAELLGAPVTLFQETLIAKTPGAGDLPWHQDYSYWPLDRPAGLTTWVALDDADDDNGCLRYAPGSHRFGERRAGWGLTGPDDERGRLPLLDEALGETEVAVPRAAGSGLAHHPLVAHRSGPNRTDRPRRAWSAFWVTDDVRWDPAHAPHPATAVDPPPPGSPLEGLPRFG